MVRFKRNNLVRVFLKNWPDDRFAYEIPYKDIRWNYPTKGFFTIKEYDEINSKEYGLYSYPITKINTLEHFSTE